MLLYRNKTNQIRSDSLKINIMIDIYIYIYRGENFVRHIYCRFILFGHVAEENFWCEAHFLEKITYFIWKWKYSYRNKALFHVLLFFFNCEQAIIKIRTLHFYELGGKKNTLWSMIEIAIYFFIQVKCWGFISFLIQ